MEDCMLLKERELLEEDCDVLLLQDLKLLREVLDERMLIIDADVVAL